MKSKRKKLLEIINDESKIILKRFGEQDSCKSGLLDSGHLSWYLNLSRQWVFHHLNQLSSRPTGSLLDVGAYYGLLAGSAERLGWKVWAIDDCLIPQFSSTRILGRKIEVSEESYNACTDCLPYPDNYFDVILLSEVLEHLPYSPLKMFREFQRVLRPGGQIQISTPNPAGLGKLISLARGYAPLEPNVRYFVKEDDTINYKGLTFFKSTREAKLWTVSEIKYCLDLCGLKLDKHFHYGTTVVMPGFSLSRKIATIIKRLFLPFLGRLPINGGSLFVVARKPAEIENTSSR